MKTHLKQSLLFAGFLIALTLRGYAQNAKTDMIIRKDNSKLEVIVVERDDHYVKYKKPENLSGPLYSISTSEVVTIVYRNGEVENLVGGAAPKSTGQEVARENEPRGQATGAVPEPTVPARNDFERNIQRMRSDELRVEYKRYKAKGSHGMGMGIVFTSLGIVAIGVGAALISDPYYYYDDYDFYYDEEKYIGGIVAIAGGVALAGGLGTVGWIKMARNKSKARVIGNELTRRKEPFISFKLTPGFNMANGAGYLTLRGRF